MNRWRTAYYWTYRGYLSMDGLNNRRSQPFLRRVMGSIATEKCLVATSQTFGSDIHTICFLFVLITISVDALENGRLFQEVIDKVLLER
jgi:hypothetical protein